LSPAPLRPARSIRPQFLSTKKLNDDLKTQWKPVFALMEEGILLRAGDDDSNKFPNGMQFQKACKGAFPGFFTAGSQYLQLRWSWAE
jgi:hypothetical protein